MQLKLITAPTIEPITMDALMTHLRIDDESMVENELLETILIAGREYVEYLTRRALLTQTWDYYLDAFPKENYIKIPFGNLATVTHIKYTDSDGTETTMTVTDDYIVETNGTECGRIVLPYGVSWPTFTAYPSNPIVIRFVAGWTASSLIQSKVLSAIKLVCSDLYANREGQVLGMSGAMYLENVTVKNLLHNQILWDEFT